VPRKPLLGVLAHRVAIAKRGAGAGMRRAPGNTPIAMSVRDGDVLSVAERGRG
jgi:hypothetical protein